MNKKLTVTTPIGNSHYTAINVAKPNYFDEKKLEYSAGIKGPLKDFKPLIAELKAWFKDNAKPGVPLKHFPIRSVDHTGTNPIDLNTLKDDDLVCLQSTTSASFEGKDGKIVNVAIPVFDSKGVKFNLGDTLIDNESRLRLKLVVAITVYGKGPAAQHGLKAFVQSVQITKLVKYNEARFEDLDDNEPDSFDSTKDAFNTASEPSLDRRVADMVIDKEAIKNLPPVITQEEVEAFRDEKLF